MSIRTSVLDYVRETLGLTGTKKGCDHGQYGACTVHINGRRVNSCLQLVAMHDGDAITTVEGLADGNRLHPEGSSAKRVRTPDEVANVAALLLGPDGGFITGSDFLMDGGVTAAYWFGDVAEARTASG